MLNDMQRILFYLLFSLGALIPLSAFALSPEASRLVGQKVKGGAMTLSEVKAMPVPCHTIGMGEINGQFWAAEIMKSSGSSAILDLPENAMAKNAVWFHHYCWGLLDKHRAFAATQASSRAFLVKTWRGEMEYIINWTAKEKINWRYLPLIYKEIAETYLQEKDYPNALRSANKSVELDAEFTAGYVLIADIYEQTKQREKALAAVTEGLKRTPTSKALQRRYKEYGGRMPFPEPYAKAEPPAIEAPGTPDPVIAAPPANSSTASPEAPVARPIVQPPGNPYCRFCP